MTTNISHPEYFYCTVLDDNARKESDEKKKKTMEMKVSVWQSTGIFFWIDCPGLPVHTHDVCVFMHACMAQIHILEGMRS
jgi:hypothetical protein